MRYILAIALALFAVSAAAGKDEYDAAVAKARIDHGLLVKGCKKLPAAEIQPCIKRVDGYLSDAIKGFRQTHLGAKK